MDIDADYILANFNINMKILMTELMIWCLLIYLVIIRVVKLIIKLYRLELFDNINILNNFNNVVHFIVHFISFLGNFNKVSNFIEFAVKIMNTLRNFNNTKVVNFHKKLSILVTLIILMSFTIFVISMFLIMIVLYLPLKF